MKRFWQFLIEGCFHEFELLEKFRYEGTNNITYRDGRTRSTKYEELVYVSRCKKCGKIVEKIVTI